MPTKLFKSKVAETVPVDGVDYVLDKDTVLAEGHPVVKAEPTKFAAVKD
jgi:hypothetical protein